MKAKISLRGKDEHKICSYAPLGRTLRDKAYDDRQAAKRTSYPVGIVNFCLTAGHMRERKKVKVFLRKEGDRFA